MACAMFVCRVLTVGGADTRPENVERACERMERLMLSVKGRCRLAPQNLKAR